MAYNVIISPRTQQEIQNSIEFYTQNSEDAPLKFITELERVYELLTINPFYRMR